MSRYFWENEVELENGNFVGYWILCMMIVDFQKDTATVTYEGYRNEEKYLAGKKILEKSVQINLAPLGGNDALPAAIIQLVRAAEGV